MKKFVTILLFTLALFVGTSAQAQTSNILVIGQETVTDSRGIYVFTTPDTGVTGTWLSYSGSITTTANAIQDKLFSGLGGQVLIVRVGSTGVMTVMLVPNTFFVPGTVQLLPSTHIHRVVYDSANSTNLQILDEAIAAIKDQLYVGIGVPAL